MVRRAVAAVCRSLRDLSDRTLEAFYVGKEKVQAVPQKADSLTARCSALHREPICFCSG